ncbi:MAG: hypothetical protein Q9227_005321 [Pyrenula ochraceoflavens]
MALLSPTVLQRIRRDPRIHRIPPYLSALCILVGVAWILLLPLDRNSRRTYISENALLPGQVHTYFGGSEQNVYRAYKQELESVTEEPYSEVSEKLQSILRLNGLKTATQTYEYESSGEKYTGENVYSVLHAPRGDGTEAVVLVVAWKNMNGESNLNGVALVLTLARYFRRWSLWSKDIIILFTPESFAGPKAWVDAYHETHGHNVGSLSLKSGALQGAVAVDFPLNHRFSNLHISYDGTNGQLPNLDLINTAVSIASGQMGISTSIQGMHNHDDSYKMRLRTLLSGMGSQATGYATGPHSVFMPYHVDAITLTTEGEGWQDEMALGRAVEGIFRSLNNLLEHFHQSFFFYLLMHTNRFVSIGTYLPSAMLIAANFTITAIALWIKSGSLLNAHPTGEDDPGSEERPPKEGLGKGKSGAEGQSHLKVDQSSHSASEGSDLLASCTIVLVVHMLGILPFYLFNHATGKQLSTLFTIIELTTFAVPSLIMMVASSYLQRNALVLIKSVSLLFLGLFLSALATLNFPLSLFVGILCSPLTFIPIKRSWLSLAILVPLHALTSPTIMLRLLLLVALRSSGSGMAQIFSQMNQQIPEKLASVAFAWNVWGTWVIGVVVWVVWWPAWVVGGVLLRSSWRLIE